MFNWNKKIDSKISKYIMEQTNKSMESKLNKINHSLYVENSIKNEENLIAKKEQFYLSKLYPKFNFHILLVNVVRLGIIGTIGFIAGYELRGFSNSLFKTNNNI